MTGGEKNRNFYAGLGIAAIMLMAACTRMYALDELPSGVLPDEAYGAYNAWGLMTEGMDSRGYTYPLYFVAWGSGMSVLYSYLAIPMFRLFGVSLLAYRLPQAIVGMVSIYAIYRIGKELFQTKFALLLAFVLAINPWHIMNTRFGLDANMAPGMFMIGIMFLILGMKKKGRYLLGAAVFMGAALYCYALTWIMIPVFLLIGTALFWKKFPSRSAVLSFAVLLFLIALPLMLFVAINLGLMREINTPFFSIPKLLGFRVEELDPDHIWNSIRRLLQVMFSQHDGVGYTSSSLVGAYYLFTTPFMVIGVLLHVVSFFRHYKNGDNDLQYVFLVWLFSALLMGVLNENITIIHVNMLHIPIVFYGVYGIYKVAEFFKNKWILSTCLVFWCFSFGVFLQHYAGTTMSYFVSEKADEVLERAKEIAGEEGVITVFDYTIIKYSYLLWYEKPSISDYYQNVRYEGDDFWAELSSFGRYRYINDLEDVTEQGIYIFRCNMEESFRDMGFEVEKVNDLYYIAIGI